MSYDLFTQPAWPKGGQTREVLTYIKRHGSISPREAMAFGCYRLAARIKDLRDMGWELKTEDEPHEGGSHARYRL